MKIKPVYDNITITPVNIADMEIPKAEDMSIGMASTERKTLDLRFRVVRVGQGRYNPHLGFHVTPLVKAGDIIILGDSDQGVREFWRDHAPVYEEGVPIMFTDEEAIHAIVEE